MWRAWMRKPQLSLRRMVRLRAATGRLQINIYTLQGRTSQGRTMTFFTNSKKYAKKIKKAEKCVVYENAVRELFGCEQLIGEVENADMEKNTGLL